MSKIISHVRKSWKTYLITTVAFLLVANPVLAAGALDDKGNAIYAKIISLGKWVIIIKGGIDLIQTIAQGDLQSAKQRFMAYLLIYAALIALPWGMDQIDVVFRDV